jgi:hypothetical protein
MARRRRHAILLADLDDCLLGVMYPSSTDRSGIPVAVYSADMIAARLRDQHDMSMHEARAFVTDNIETNELGPGTPRLIWAATAEDFGTPVCKA